MIRAYSEVYLGMVFRNLGSLFDMAAYIEDMDMDTFASVFSRSQVARGIEAGSPLFLAGMSPQDMFERITLRKPLQHVPPSETSDAAWTGSVIAYAQWYCGCRFVDMQAAVPASRIMAMHRTFRDDTMAAVSIVVDTLHPVTVLKRLREDRGMSQSDLALMSGVPIRSIRAYEQGSVELCKAQGDTLYNLARALGCSTDTLIRG